MAGFARSFKPPSFLSPHLRPAMPGRTLSSSSDTSLASNASGRSDDGETATSAPQTPTLAGADDHHDARDSLRSSRSRPIAIDLPNITKLHAAPTCTPPPPEPLSARGDLPGGYFPMHEDPLARVHHPHPFHNDGRGRPQRHANLAGDSGPAYVERSHHQASAMAPMARSNTPVASYIPPGFHDCPQPMGKYYPSNWEQRKHRRPSLAETPPGSAAVKTDSQLPPPAMSPSSPAPTSPHPGGADADARRKMQQYQRDMVAQATLALGGPGGGTSSGGKPMKMTGLSLKDMRLGHGASQKPVAPKLMPLGSPGPVTPMELEGAGGGYLDKGLGSERRSRDGRAAVGAGYAAHTMS